MLITFQIFLFVTMIIGFFGSIGEREDENLRGSMTAITIASILALTTTFILL